MDTTRIKFTINPETGRKIKVGTLSWKRLATKYYMMDGVFTNQVIPDSRALKVKGSKESKALKACKTRKRVVDPTGMKSNIVVGSKSWNERYLECEWNGHEFGKKQKQLLPEFMSMWRRDERYDETSSLLYLMASRRRTLVGCDSILTWVCTHLLSHHGWRHVQKMDEWDTNQEGLSPQERWWKENMGSVSRWEEWEKVEPLN